MKLDELAFACSNFGNLRNFNGAYDVFLNQTSNELDMLNAEHRQNLLCWLNAWLCRQFEIYYHDFASTNLQNWYEKNKTLLPSHKMDISQFDKLNLRDIGYLFDSLSHTKATPYKNVGPTGASKILFALRKDLFIPCDIKMRKQGRYDDNGISYVSFLNKTRQEYLELKNDCENSGVDIRKISEKLHGKSYSMNKLIDEYHFITITHGIQIPDKRKLNEWFEKLR